jgi:Aldehyde dehydrogenase family
MEIPCLPRLLKTTSCSSTANGQMRSTSVLLKKQTREESFGPLASIVIVANAKEALRQVNDTECGLSGAVFTGCGKSQFFATG